MKSDILLFATPKEMAIFYDEVSDLYQVEYFTLVGKKKQGDFDSENLSDREWFKCFKSNEAYLYRVTVLYNGADVTLDEDVPYMSVGTLKAILNGEKAENIQNNLSSFGLCRELQAAWVKKYGADFDFNICGPFGIRANTSIFVHEKGKSKIIGLLTVERDENGWYKYETGEKKKEFPVESTGWCNELNNVTAALPNTYSDCLNLMKAIA